MDGQCVGSRNGIIALIPRLGSQHGNRAGRLDRQFSGNRINFCDIRRLGKTIGNATDALAPGGNINVFISIIVVRNRFRLGHSKRKIGLIGMLHIHGDRYRRCRLISTVAGSIQRNGKGTARLFSGDVICFGINSGILRAIGNGKRESAIAVTARCRQYILRQDVVHHRNRSVHERNGILRRFFNHQRIRSRNLMVVSILCFCSGNRHLTGFDESNDTVCIHRSHILTGGHCIGNGTIAVTAGSNIGEAT